MCMPRCDAPQREADFEHAGLAAWAFVAGQRRGGLSRAQWAHHLLPGLRRAAQQPRTLAPIDAFGQLEDECLGLLAPGPAGGEAGFAAESQLEGFAAPLVRGDDRTPKRIRTVERHIEAVGMSLATGECLAAQALDLQHEIVDAGLQ